MGESSFWIESPCYHEPKVHDHELYQQLITINLCLLIPLTILGLFFNASALICLYSPPKITSGVFVYLKALLILDHCLILVTSATILIPQFCDNHHSSHHTFYEFCMFERRFLKYTMPRIESTVNTMHAWTIASLSVHRYWKISRPVVSRMKDTVKRAHVILFAVLMLTFIFRLPTFLIELQVKEKPELLLRKRKTATEFLSLYRIVYHSFLQPIFSNVLPFLAMSIFSILTLYEICRSAHFHYSHFSSDGMKKVASSQPLKTCLQKKTDALRQKQELRATISIVVIILLYLIFHSLQIYDVVRKWQLLFSNQCPTRRDYLQSHIGTVLSLLSASVDAFVFIAFTNRLRQYVQMLIRKTSHSNSSEPPLSPRTTTTVEAAPLTAVYPRSYRQDGTFV
uniref:G_PROTEIN_RECEP_F1_2 domain-containing protein n=1 Tax=Steinernema glaseri TaxID=37863 RepID=A0A1I7YA98_9BILA